MMRDSGPNSTTPGRAGSLAAAAAAAFSASAARWIPEISATRTPPFAGHRELLRRQRLAVNRRRRLDQRAGGDARRTGRGPARRWSPVRGRAADRERHQLTGDVVAHPLAQHAHGHGGVGQLRRRQRRAGHRAGIRHRHLRERRRRAEQRGQQRGQKRRSEGRGFSPGRAAPHNFAPQDLQKRASGSFSVPHSAHDGASATAAAVASAQRLQAIALRTRRAALATSRSICSR